MNIKNNNSHRNRVHVFTSFAQITWIKDERAVTPWLSLLWKPPKHTWEWRRAPHHYKSDHRRWIRGAFSLAPNSFQCKSFFNHFSSSLTSLIDTILLLVFASGENLLVEITGWGWCRKCEMVLLHSSHAKLLTFLLLYCCCCWCCCCCCFCCCCLCCCCCYYCFLVIFCCRCCC